VSAVLPHALTSSSTRVRIAPSDLKMCIAGHFLQTPYHEYPDGLPETCFTSRQGLETLIRRLVLDITKYPNIKYVSGSATEYHADPKSPIALHKVTISESGGEAVELDADLVLGWSSLQPCSSHSLTNRSLDCTGSFHTGVNMLKSAGYGFAETYPKGKLSLEDIRLSYDPKMYYCTMELTIPPALAKRLPIPGGIDSHPAIALFSGNKNERRILYLIGIDGPYRSKLDTSFVYETVLI
jgi:hypothetical protein